MFAQLISTLKKSPKTIVFTEGTDPRILEASARLLSGNFLKPVLVGNPDEIADAAEDIGFNIRGAEIIDPENYDGMDEMVDEMVALRKGKMTADECRAALKKSNYFGTMLVKMGKADCLLGGATYSTADTVRPALQLIKTKPGNKIVSSCFIMVRPAASGENEVLAMADCAINIKPNEDELVEICKETVSCAKIFGVDPKVAFLTPPSAPARARTSTRCAMPARRPRPSCPTPRSAASSSSTRRSLRLSPKPSTSPTRSAATPIPLSSPTSTPATSATRSPSVSAPSTPTARSCSV